MYLEAEETIHVGNNRHFVFHGWSRALRRKREMRKTYLLLTTVKVERTTEVGLGDEGFHDVLDLDVSCSSRFKTHESPQLGPPSTFPPHQHLKYYDLGEEALPFTFPFKILNAAAAICSRALAS